ncbi:lipase family protein [Ascoidea rubescens DSM 1968]|uniref:triacylglycerol lipase n=1 Tax=Ascoidea rubescens DSM 1968 TaxID=1344418 RepID=A0A1D2VBM2_9ASCO|nr:alpha/beta-hydrolase [Ascoidea rubescens DSM 1968]ODV59078.1 alpha/beta-hydrolase [Ascoidea rubescens DSM 1968]
MMDITQLLFLFISAIAIKCCYSYSDETYDQLVQGINYCTVTSCIDHGLTLGELPDSCQLSLCINDLITSKLQIHTIFQPNKHNNDRLPGMTGFTAVNHINQEIIVAFRGSTKLIDWLTDSIAKPVPYSPILSKYKECGDSCLVHLGFYSALKNSFRVIRESVVSLRKTYPDYRLFITGHSMGAVFAILAGIEFQLSGYDPLIISYGLPKFGNMKMCEWIDEIFDTENVSYMIEANQLPQSGYITVIHRGDYVPYLPFGSLYSSAGANFFIYKKHLPHEKHDVVFQGSNLYNIKNDIDQLDQNEIDYIRSVSTSFDILHKYEHGRYFDKVTQSPQCPANVNRNDGNEEMERDYS